MNAPIEWTFWIAVLALVHAYALYPLLMAARARMNPLPPLRRAQLPPVTIVVIARDAAGQIEAKLCNCLTLDYPHDLLKVLVICDGSNDDTAARVRAFESPRVRLIENAQPLGRAACLSQAASHASGDVVVFTNVECELERNAVHAVLEDFGDAGVGIVNGVVHQPGELALRVAESMSGSTPVTSTALLAVRAGLLPRLLEPGLDEQVMPMNAARRGYRTTVMPKARARMRQTATLDRVRRLAMRWRLVLRRPGLMLPVLNPVWARYCSHIVLRLAAPLFAIVALASGAVLAADSLFYQLLLAMQIALYGLALAGLRLRVLRASRLARLPARWLDGHIMAVRGLISMTQGRDA